MIDAIAFAGAAVLVAVELLVPIALFLAIGWKLWNDARVQQTWDELLHRPKPR